MVASLQESFMLEEFTWIDLPVLQPSRIRLAANQSRRTLWAEAGARLRRKPRLLGRPTLSWWLCADRNGRRFSAPYEFETFAFFAWPMVVPYYLYRTRRGRGLLLFFAVGELFIPPYVVAAIIGATAEIRALR
jgi:hypothetical protein